MAWWKVLQPAWRCTVDGILSTDMPKSETWATLSRGGSSGIYTVVIALSWWIRALPAQAEVSDAGVVDAWAAVADLQWVMERMRLGLGKSPSTQGTKRERKNTLVTASKKCIFYPFYLCSFT